LRQFGCLTGAKKVCWPPFTILWLLEPTLKGDLIVLGFYGVVNFGLIYFLSYLQLKCII
jgi:hypothetical protein